MGTVVLSCRGEIDLGQTSITGRKPEMELEPRRLLVGLGPGGDRWGQAKRRGVDDLGLEEQLLNAGQRGRGERPAAAGLLGEISHFRQHGFQ
jgi:hypothetical protein